MKLQDMARDPSTADSMYGVPCSPTVSPYPYGLRLNLTQDDLAKIGYKDLPPAGTELHLEAVGIVTRASSEDPDADGDIDYLCVEVQITQLGVEEGEASSGEDSDRDSAGRSDRLYGKAKAA